MKNQENAAKIYGDFLSKLKDINHLNNVEAPFGTFKRLGRVRALSNVDKKHEYKKNVFELKSGGTSFLVIYFSGKEYDDVPDFFKKMYQNTKKVLLGKPHAIPTPKLLSYDNGTMTLVIEKLAGELGRYSNTKSTIKLQKIHNETINLFLKTWEVSKGKSKKLPRYVETFLRPQHASIKNVKISSLITNTDTLEAYAKTQKAVRKFIKDLSLQHIETGIGNGDIKPDNIVEDNAGRLFFVDVGKSSEGYHWLTMLGIYYQSTVETMPNTPFSNTLRTAVSETLQQYKNQKEGIELFLLGRINKFLLPCTMWNIYFLKRVGLNVNENDIGDRLGKVRVLTKIENINEALLFASDKFEDGWRDRLKEYPKTKEFKANINLLQKELDMRLPKQKPNKQAVFIFMGIPGSGKSTVAKILETNGVGVAIHSDWIYFRKLKKQIEGDYYKAYAYLESLLKHYIENGFSVIIDENKRTKKTRESIYNLARNVGAEVILIAIKICVDTAVKREKPKGGGDNSYDARRKVLETFESQMEYPTRAERKLTKIIEVDGKKSIEDIENLIIKQLNDWEFV
ncbi:MAG: hypothetical protein UX73_C0017G0004 [candidate division WWE3 bacterium GW2011_GWC1_47_10]|uniref:Uncharacterized protein n=1 Tax=candidate division WWE3 bacterium GW2011_GWC1_47_10 TaxID=1619122 RepID=A0A0G1R0G6_UNCKA|nr:MAG: hypothetical protein UX73_C0017G0004 [candidate division WWE3 bacterium GW2011_GWC1_47_10]